MSNMDENSTSQEDSTAKCTSNFMKYLIRNLQNLCQGHVQFSKNIEVIGHIYLNVDDSTTKFNYFLNEIVSKNDSSETLFKSNSFQAKPDPENAYSSQASAFAQVNENSASASTPSTPKVQIIQTENSSSIPSESEQSSLFLPKIINVHSVSQKNNADRTAEPKNISIHVSAPRVETPSPKIDNILSLASKTQTETFNSVSEILKNIKKEPVDEITEIPEVTRRKRKPDHTTRIDPASMKLEPIEPTSPSCTTILNKKPKIMKHRPTSAAILSRKPKPKPPELSPHSSFGDDLSASFAEGLENSGVFPVGILQNMAGAGTSDGSLIWVNLQSQLDSNKKLQSTPGKKRGTYNFYSQEEKHKAVELAAQFGIAPICQKFDIPSSTLWTWRKQFERYQEAKQSKEKAVKTEPETNEEKVKIKIEPGIKVEPETT